MQDTTLCYILKGEHILLGLKKKNQGEGLWNGFGGKVEIGESIEEATIREVKEECNLDVTNIQKVGVIDFIFTEKPEWNQTMHIFLTHEYAGELKESDEMTPQWFKQKELPTNMWKDDPYWLPQVLQGQKVIASFTFDKDNIKEKEIKFVEEL